MDQEDQLVSLIGLVIGITMQAAAGTAGVPEEAVYPLMLASVAHWLQLPEDSGRTFEQKIELVMPDGTIRAEATLPFTMEKISHTGIARFGNFPVGVAGTYHIRASLREVAEGREWEEVGNLPLIVTHLPPVNENEQA